MKTRILLILLLVSIVLNLILLKERKQVVRNDSGRPAKYADFYTDFENGSSEGWSGDVTKEPTAAGSKFSLVAPAINNPYFACAVSKNFKNRLEIGSNTKLEFDYFIEDSSILRIQMYSPGRKDNFYYDIQNPAAGQWTKISVSLAQFKDNAHTGISPQRQDIFSNIQIYGGTSGENTKLFIDNVKINGAQ